MAELLDAFVQIESVAKKEIYNSYLLSNGEIGSHFLWDNDSLKQIWYKKGHLIQKVTTMNSSIEDVNQPLYKDYTTKSLRELRFFNNSRINSKQHHSWDDLFTKRALRNIEILRREILNIQNETVRAALLLALTASSGQMSNMVFAVENRGKISGTANKSNIEVGSWVIGFWKPKIHFEVNVWNCFQNKFSALSRGIKEQNGGLLAPSTNSNPTDVIEDRAQYSLQTCNAIDAMKKLPENSIDVIITDPPHGDRIPYLELSEIWNAIIDVNADFTNEIVISNASDRNNSSDDYWMQLKLLFHEASKVVKPEGCIVLIFNSRSENEWQQLIDNAESQHLKFKGCFPMNYSAGSVVQDSRKGALKQDYILLFHPVKHRAPSSNAYLQFSRMSNWSNTIPRCRI